MSTADYVPTIQVALRTLRQNLRDRMALSATFTPDTIQPGERTGTWVLRRRKRIEHDFIEYGAEIWIVAGFRDLDDFNDGCVEIGEELAYCFDSLRHGCPPMLWRIEMEDESFPFIASSRASSQMAPWVLDVLAPCTITLSVRKRYG